MDLIPFVALFPVQAIAETRSVTVRGHAQLPDDSYAMVESYCPDPKCDCRRVMIGVLPQSNPRCGFLASISFGFDRNAEMAGPFLDPLNPQSRYAEALLALFQELITDPRLRGPAGVALSPGQGGDALRRHASESLEFWTSTRGGEEGAEAQARRARESLRLSVESNLERDPAAYLEAGSGDQ